MGIALPKRPAPLAMQEIIMNNIRVGIVGTGFMAVAHLRAYEAVDGIEVGALCVPGRNLDEMDVPATSEVTNQ